MVAFSQIAGITRRGVCDIRSWPAGFPLTKQGKGRQKNWDLCKSEFGYASDADACEKAGRLGVTGSWVGCGLGLAAADEQSACAEAKDQQRPGGGLRPGGERQIAGGLFEGPLVA
jgi:hypothetical protein